MLSSSRRLNLVVLTEEKKFDYLPKDIQNFLIDRSNQLNLLIDELLESSPLDLWSEFSRVYDNYKDFILEFQNLLLEKSLQEGEKPEKITEVSSKLIKTNIDLLKDLYDETDQYYRRLAITRVETLKESIMVLIDLNDWMLGNWTVVDSNKDPEFQKLMDSLVAHLITSWLCLAIEIRALSYESGHFKKCWNNFDTILTWMKAYTTRLDILIDTASFIADPSKAKELKESLMQIDEEKTERIDFEKEI